MAAPRTPATRAASASEAVLQRRKAQLTKLCEGYPETVAISRYDNDHLSLEVAGKRFGYYLYQHFGDDGRSGAVLKAALGVQEMLVEADPDRFWVPAFVGRHGWIGVRLDIEEPDWEELEMFLREAWLLAAPKKVRQAFEASL